MKKNELLKECSKIMREPHIQKWYKENLDGKPQLDTLSTLEKGVFTHEITVKDALAIALIVGVQWEVKFEGVS